MLRSRTTRQITAGAAVLAAAGLLVAMLGRERPLHERAALLLAVPPQAGAGGIYGPSYAWWDGERVLMWQLSQAAPGRVRQDFRAFRIGTGTPVEQRAPFSRQADGMLMAPRVSPDGKWLLQGEVPGASPTRRRVGVLNLGSGEHRAIDWTAPRWDFPGVSPAWSPDSRSWVTLQMQASGASAFFYRPESSRACRTAALRPPDPPIPSVMMAGDAWTLLGIERSGTAVATTWRPGQVIDVYLILMPLADANPRCRSLRLRIPSDGRVDEVALSPEGDRLAWRFYFERSPGRLSKLARYLPFLRPRVTSEIWVSRLDGSQMRRLGSEPVRATTQIVDPSFPIGIAWKPDGKRISFIYKGSLYAVDAD